MNLARHQAIVSRLTAIEELAGVDVFCSDKTGTLTRNEMQVAEPVTLDGHDVRELFLYALLASRQENRDPVELPLFHYVSQTLPDLDWQSWRQREFVPFDPVRKRTEAEVERDHERLRVYKGAPQVLMELTELPDNEAVAIANTVELLATKGYRTLAVAVRRGEGAPELVGLIPLIDPPREDSAEVIRAMRHYGVRVKMVTGDNQAIAREIGRMLGLAPRVMRGAQLSGKSGTELIEMASALTTAIYRRLRGDVSLREARRFADGVMDELKRLYDTSILEREFVHTHESALIAMIEDIDIFAEVVPEDKYLLVDRLQKADHMVGMTGDGVNDAPALRKADCGFAVANATDAARAAADIVLTAPGLSVISTAVRQARITFERMQSYAVYRIAETIRVLLFMTLSIVVFDFYPITAIMIVILALLNDIPILAIAYDRTRVRRQPVRWNMSELLTMSSVLGVAGVISSFLLFFLLQERGLPEPFIQSVIFLKLIVAGHLTIFLTRTGDWWWRPPRPAPVLFHASLWSAVLGTVICARGWWVEPIGWQAAGLVWLYAGAWFLFNDAVKMGARRLLGPV